MVGVGIGMEIGIQMEMEMGLEVGKEVGEISPAECWMQIVICGLNVWWVFNKCAKAVNRSSWKSRDLLAGDSVIDFWLSADDTRFKIWDEYN